MIAIYNKAAVASLIFAGLSAIAIAKAGILTDRYGPFTCNTCLLQTPQPDAATLSFILGHRAFSGMRNGNVITICGPSACVSYTRTDYRNFEGGPVRPMTQGNPGGGTGSGGAQTGGRTPSTGPISGGGGRTGTVTVGGGGGGRTGSVTVGPSGPLPKLPKGSQEI